MQRCRIARTTQPDGATDQQGEDTDGREHEIQGPGTVGHGCEAKVEDLSRAKTENRVAKRPLIAAGVVQHIDDVSRAFNRLVVDGKKQVTAGQPNAIRRTSLRDLLNDSPVCP